MEIVQPVGAQQRWRPLESEAPAVSAGTSPGYVAPGHRGRDPVRRGSAAPAALQPPLLSPTGQPYRFRDLNGPDAAGPQSPKYRPDTRLGQMPKNWRPEPEWAKDPVLQRGLTFRPLKEKKPAPQPGVGMSPPSVRTVPTAPYYPPATGMPGYYGGSSPAFPWVVPPY
ncbi:MAG: hypothetical protein ABFS23_09070 [Pseudomonadota bacterium]